MSALVQRWRERRDAYRPAGEVIDTAAHEVVEIEGDAEARAFVVGHHYSASYPAARWRFGLVKGGELVGVAVFSHPCNDAVITGSLPVSRATDGVELGRFVLLDSVPGNGETWFLARCFEALRREGLGGVVSFSDPMERTRADGTRLFAGHVGTIYQASNGRFTGRGRARLLRLLPDGRVFSDRALQKIRSQDSGSEYAISQLVAAGARRPGQAEDLVAWLQEVLPSATRRARHPGNYRYVWGLHPAVARRLPAGLPFPKAPAGLSLQGVAA